jgi:hypothetical protein
MREQLDEIGQEEVVLDDLWVVEERVLREGVEKGEGAVEVGLGV